VSEAGLTIREVVARTGVEASTLRMWEQRHGFPEPGRRPSGHRRYSQRDVDLILQLLRDRQAGLGLGAAIEKAKRSPAGGPSAWDGSIYAGLRRRHPDLVPYVLAKPVLDRLSHAIEDECSARAQRPVLLASFQRERFYRQAEARWRDLARPAECAVVLADFAELRHPSDGPVEVPIGHSAPVAREWSLVCDASELTALMAGWERPGQDEAPDAGRQFELVWSVEPELVREAALLAAAIVERSAVHVARTVRAKLEHESHLPGSTIEVLTALTNRMVAYVGGATPLPAPHSS